jgi:anti-sigma-K factor RskA
MKHDNETHLLSGAYALDALTPAEVVAMEAAMAASEELRGEVAELTDTAVLLGLAVEPVAPPAGMRDRLLATIAATPQLAPLAEKASAPSDELETASTGRVVQGPKHWFQRPTALIGAVAAAMVIFIGGSVAGQVLDQSSATVREASSFSTLFSASDLHHTATKTATGGVAIVMWSPSLHKSAVVLKDVATVPADKVLQLWYIDGTKITSAGLFTPSGDQKFEMLTRVPKSGEKVGVTVEPAGGSKQPTTAPIAVLSA